MNLEEKIKELEKENAGLKEELALEIRARKEAQKATVLAQRLGITYKNETGEVYRLLGEAHKIMQRHASEIFGPKPAEKILPTADD